MVKSYFLALSFLFTMSPQAKSCKQFCASLKVTVTKLRSKKGKVRILLAKDAKNFQANNPKDVDAGKVFFRETPADQDRILFVFPTLDSGDYAFKVIHDENNNQILDTNLLGIPTEGLAVSHQPKMRPNMVNFDKAKFQIRASQTKVFEIPMLYAKGQSKLKNKN